MDLLPEPELRFLKDLRSWCSFEDWRKSDGWESLGVQGARKPRGITISQEGHIVKVDLTANNLVGEIPLSIGNCKWLRELRLNTNKLRGPLPVQICSLTELTHLHLAHNRLSGPIPHRLGGLAQLQELLLGTNQLEGEIPGTFGNLTQLQELVLHSNRLEGAVPASLGSCFALRRLILSGNRLTSVPHSLGALQELREINLSNMPTLKGQPAPRCLGAMRKLTQVWLQQSPFQGELPAALGALPELTHFGAEWCEFEGAVPRSFKVSETLRHSNLWRNCLRGRRGQRLPTRLNPLGDESGEGGGGGGGGGERDEDEVRPVESLRARLHRSPGMKAKLRKANARRSAARALSKQRVAEPRPPPGPPPPSAKMGGYLNGRKLPVVQLKRTAAGTAATTAAAPSDWQRPVVAPAPMANEDHPKFQRLMRMTGHNMKKLPPQQPVQTSPMKQMGPDRAHRAAAALLRRSSLAPLPADGMPSKLPSLR